MHYLQHYRDICVVPLGFLVSFHPEYRYFYSRFQSILEIWLTYSLHSSVPIQETTSKTTLVDVCFSILTARWWGMLSREWPSTANSRSPHLKKKVHFRDSHRQCLFCRLNAIYPVRLSALYINTKSKSSPPQCVIPARRTLLC